MLTDSQKLRLRGEIHRGCILPLVHRAYFQADCSEYNELCEFIISELRRFHELPADKHARFCFHFDTRFGQTSTAGPWHEGGRDEFQFEGETTLHPAPSPIASPPPAAKRFLGVRYRPKHETRRAALPVVDTLDFKMSQAHDTE